MKQFIGVIIMVIVGIISMVAAVAALPFILGAMAVGAVLYVVAVLIFGRSKEPINENPFDEDIF